MNGFGLALAGLLLGLGCTRPVELPPGGSTFLSELKITPEHVRDGVPITLSFRVAGLPPRSVSYELAGQRHACTPEIASGRYTCVHPGLARTEAAQGTALVVVEATDPDGRVASLAQPITIDFDCPRFLALALSAAVAGPGQSVSLTLEASEELAEAPRVTRLGRDWGPVVGAGRSWSVRWEVTAAEPAEEADVVVRLRDRAGNTTADCGADGRVPLAVDHHPPVTQVAALLLTRGAPGQPAPLSASPGAFVDDVEVAAVRVFDDTGTALLATVVPRGDGGLDPTSLGIATASRVQVEAVDRLGRTSPRASIPERWRITVGAGATPGAALRTGVRFTAAPPGSTALRNRTVELAPDVFEEDARTAILRARVGYEKVGELPGRYEDVNSIAAGYDPQGRSIVAAGGYRGSGYNVFANFLSDVLVIAWDEREGRYVIEQGPPLSFTDPAAPAPRYGVNLAFDDQGCGVLYGGDARVSATQARLVGDVWQICHTPGGYVWRPVLLDEQQDGFQTRKLSPIIWDPLNRRFVTVGGASTNAGRVLFLEPGADPSSWRWTNVTPLPTQFVGRSGNFLYFDPRLGAFAVGLGFVNPTGNGQERILWSHRDGQWAAAEVPPRLRFRTGFAWAYDDARHRLAVWGGNDHPPSPALPETWYLTATATTGPSGWREARLDPPMPRDYPSMVWDPDREVVVIFGGVRPQDGRVVAPDIHQLISEPSYPYLQASADLAAARPKGIARLELTVRASGLGDADGTGPGTARAAGIDVLLYDHEAERWVRVARTEPAESAGLETLRVEVTERPERFVGLRGAVPITLVPRAPATEAVDGRLEVDLLDGALELRSGVALP